LPVVLRMLPEGSSSCLLSHCLDSSDRHNSKLTSSLQANNLCALVHVPGKFGFVVNVPSWLLMFVSSECIVFHRQRVAWQDLIRSFLLCSCKCMQGFRFTYSSIANLFLRHHSSSRMKQWDRVVSVLDSVHG